MCILTVTYLRPGRFDDVSAYEQIVRHGLDHHLTLALAALLFICVDKRTWLRIEKIKNKNE